MRVLELRQSSHRSRRPSDRCARGPQWSQTGRRSQRGKWPLRVICGPVLGQGGAPLRGYASTDSINARPPARQSHPDGVRLYSVHHTDGRVTRPSQKPLRWAWAPSAASQRWEYARSEKAQPFCTIRPPVSVSPAKWRPQMMTEPAPAQAGGRLVSGLALTQRHPPSSVKLGSVAQLPENPRKQSDRAVRRAPSNPKPPSYPPQTSSPIASVRQPQTRAWVRG